MDRTSCTSCRELQRCLMDFSVRIAKAHTERLEAMKSARRIHEARIDAEGEAAALERVQAELADRLQVAEQAVEELGHRKRATEKLWREEAGSWQSAHEEAKVAAGHAESATTASKDAAIAAQAEVGQLRKSLESVLWELEDARTAYGATERRVASDSALSEEQVARARAAATAAQQVADSARSSLASVEARLAAAVTSESNGAALRLRAERQRSKDLEAQLAEGQRRVEAGRAALKRLRGLREEAILRLENSVDAKMNPVSDGARPQSQAAMSKSPLRPSSSAAAANECEQAAAARVLRVQLREREYQLGELENEHIQLRRLQQLDAERHAAKAERLRAKAERYRAGHEDLQRLYLARRATA